MNENKGFNPIINRNPRNQKKIFQERIFNNTICMSTPQSHINKDISTISNCSDIVSIENNMGCSLDGDHNTLISKEKSKCMSSPLYDIEYSETTPYTQPLETSTVNILDTQNDPTHNDPTHNITPEDASDYTLCENNPICPGILLRNLKLKNINRLNLAHININSLRNKFEGLKEVINNNVDILVVSETKLDISFPASQFHLPGYDRKSFGGVGT